MMGKLISSIIMLMVMLFLMLVFVLSLMLPFVMMFMLIIMVMVFFHGYRNRSGIVCADCRAGSTTDCSAQNCALLPANLISDCRTGGSAHRPAHYRTAIRGKSVHAYSKQ